MLNEVPTREELLRERLIDECRGNDLEPSNEILDFLLESKDEWQSTLACEAMRGNVDALIELYAQAEVLDRWEKRKGWLRE